MRGASPVLSSTSRGAWFIVLSRRLDDEARLGEDRRVVRPARSHHHGSQEVEFKRRQQNSAPAMLG